MEERDGRNEIRHKDEVSDEYGDNEITVENTSVVRSEPVQDATSPPKVKSPMEMLHEKVNKQIIKEGYGKQPSQLSTCFLHYRAWVKSTLHKFEDTWQEQHPTELVLGKEKGDGRVGDRDSKHEKRGEGTVTCGMGIGYGKEGSFSFPNVPPMADLLYEVELIGFDEAKEGKARSDMTVEERIEAADKRKKEGNALFAEEKLEEAMQQYEMYQTMKNVFQTMGDDFMFQLFGKYRDMALAVKNPCHLNMAQCLIKLNRYDEAIAQCTIVLSEEENNVKALFRRGKARAALGQMDSARDDLQKAQKIAPEDIAIIRELKLAKHEKEVYQKQKELYKGLFGPRPEEPKPKKSSNNYLIEFFAWLFALFSRLFKRSGCKSE